MIHFICIGGYYHQGSPQFILRFFKAVRVEVRILVRGYETFGETDSLRFKRHFHGSIRQDVLEKYCEQIKNNSIGVSSAAGDKKSNYLFKITCH